VRPQRPVRARQSPVVSQEESVAPILKELERISASQKQIEQHIMESQEQMCAEKTTP